MARKSLLLLQLLLVLLVIAFVPGNLEKLCALLVVWVTTFGRLKKTEVLFSAIACLFFSGMNAMSLSQGIFRFSSPDFLGMPVYEFFMWGFYLLHLVKLIEGPTPESGGKTALIFAIMYSAAFASISDQNILLWVTGVLLALALVIFHEKWDLYYTGYLILLGACIEYTGVYSGQWSYPGSPIGGVPMWFITLWGGVGLFTRRLALPIVRNYS